MATINIGTAFDQNYLRHFFALLASIFSTNRNNHIVAHCIVTGLADRIKAQIESYAQENGAEVHFYQIDEKYLEQFTLSGNWSAAIYYRLFFPFLVPDTVEKLLYMDTDIIAVNDLAPLYNSAIDGYTVGAIYDKGVEIAPHLGITEPGNYFNSGVLLMNVPLWKEQKVTEKVFEYLAQRPDRIDYPDQDALNVVLMNKWKKLDSRFNSMHFYIPEGMSIREKAAFLKEKLVLIHFTRDRPWKMLCRHPYRALYHTYSALSPFETTNKYVDYSVQNSLRYLKIRAAELYFNLPVLKNAWRRVKRMSPL